MSELPPDQGDARPDRRAIGLADSVYILRQGDVILGDPSQCASGVVSAGYLGANA